jgi:hypothetical protein
VTRSGVERFEPPVVEDEQLHATERPQDAGVAAIAAGKREIGEQFWDALIEDGTVVTTGFVTERRGEPTLADAGQASDMLHRNIRLKLSSIIRIIPAPEKASLFSGA